MKAFNAGDLEGVLRDFSKDAIYVTEDGRTLKGIDDIKKEFADQFEDLKGATLKLNVYAIEFSPDKQRATERGVSIVTTPDGIQDPSSYVAEFVAQDKQWKVSRVVEKPQAITAEHMQDLAWMIGDWNDQSEDASIRTKAEWSLNRGFIARKFAVSGEGLRELAGIEYIGWDPIKNQIRSSYFDSDGGYGTGVWRHEGNRWIEEVSGVTPAGEVATATHILTPKDQNTFTWSTIHRRVGGSSMEDLPEIVIHRTSSAQLEAARGQL